MPQIIGSHLVGKFANTLMPSYCIYCKVHCLVIRVWLT